MPNKLGGCGIQTKTSDLFQYAASEKSDPGLTEILKTFEAAYPYLKFIAQETGIIDPFDQRVVEAYWVGNDLLYQIDKKRFYDWCFDRYGKLADRKALRLLVGTVPMGALPHHSFHVFNSYLRNKHFADVVKFMNSCRITPCVVIEIKEAWVKAEYRPIIFGLKGFEFGGKETKKVYTKIGDKGFINELKIGDTISSHWDWACDRLTKKQAENLDKITEAQLGLFNNISVFNNDM